MESHRDNRAQSRVVSTRLNRRRVSRPWENKQRAQTPQQVRRGLAKFLPELGTPAHSPKPRGKALGRSPGTRVHKAKHFPVVRKTGKTPHPVPI